ncbi:MAG TPA: tRNA (cytidine(34)-2'-O)-methyltransferase [Kiritimatiellia bacterium]|nr:tRNA (cytidine(34)-2'-O)-methyltransferase [Kiritimatiellia bacterium]
MKHSHSRRYDHPIRWPHPPLNVVLVEPEIPPNTGNIARMCAATGSRLHLVEPLGFSIDDAKLRRAGLDYWDAIAPILHPNLDAFFARENPPRFFLYSTGGSLLYTDITYQPGDYLLFGSETRGLPDDLLARHPHLVAGIPLLTQHVRSLNLSTAAGIVVYEAIRQLQLGLNTENG